MKHLLLIALATTITLASFSQSRTQEDSITTPKLKHSIRAGSALSTGFKISGAVILPIGISSMVTGTGLLISNMNSQGEQVYLLEKRVGIALLSTGGALTLSGAIFLGMGNQLYRDIVLKNRKTVSLGVLPNGDVGLSLKF